MYVEISVIVVAFVMGVIFRKSPRVLAISVVGIFLTNLISLGGYLGFGIRLAHSAVNPNTGSPELGFSDGVYSMANVAQNEIALLAVSLSAVSLLAIIGCKLNGSKSA